uniref:Ovule protein n=1 Tax=Parascaris univalens TaxID=6257 RepID=A0A915BLX7_PARUN
MILLNRGHVASIRNSSNIMVHKVVIDCTNGVVIICTHWVTVFASKCILRRWFICSDIDKRRFSVKSRSVTQFLHISLKNASLLMIDEHIKGWLA